MKLSDAVAVCIIAQDGSGKILILKSAPSKRRGYEIPGGGIEPGEEPEDAAARELWEETGLRPTRMRLVYLDNEKSGKVVACFLATCEGTPVSGCEGEVFWGEPGILLRSTNTYADYNRKALKAAGIKVS